MKKLTGLELINKITEFSSSQHSVMVQANYAGKVTPESNITFLSFDKSASNFWHELSRISDVISYTIELENGAIMESITAGRKLITLSYEFSQGQNSPRKSISYTTREDSGYLATRIVKFVNNAFEKKSAFDDLESLDAVIDYEIELENGTKLGTKDDFWSVSEAKEKNKSWHISEIHTNATFEETLEEIKQSKNPTRPNYYKIPESEVVELFERLGNDSTEYLSTSQIINLSHCIKYLLRAPYKGKLEDLQKAKFFLDRILEGGQE